MTTNPLHPIPDEPADNAVVPAPRPKPTKEEYAAWIIVGAAVLFVMFQHLVGALIAGLALYLILDKVSDSFSQKLSGKTARPLALLIVSLIVISGGVGIIALLVYILRHSAGKLPDMMNQMAAILESTRAWLGGYGEQMIPEFMTDAEDMKVALALWLKTHAQTLRAAGGWLSIGVVHVIFGALVAILAFLRHVRHHDQRPRGTLSRELSLKVRRFAEAFGRIVSAQVKISAVNTTLTAIYLLVALPLFGKKLPFSTTLVVITFIAGLIPVLGNLISNTVITILSLGISVWTAIASLGFLIVIHKLEYLINSRIVGGETDSQAWEILLAIIIGESAFGAAGVIMAPIVYAFVKRELRDRGLV